MITFRVRAFFLTAAVAISVAVPAHWASAQVQADANKASPPLLSPPAKCPAILQHSFARLQDEKPQDLCQYRGKVILVVNTASYCGFTSQYKGLEELYSRYKDRGLVVLGFPSNDFSQERGSNQQIADFCENTYGVKFPMFAKTSVKGADANTLYQQLSQQSGGDQPQWNFYKYLLSRDGRVAAHYGSMVGPDSTKMVSEIEKQLAAH